MQIKIQQIRLKALLLSISFFALWFSSGGATRRIAHQGKAHGKEQTKELNEKKTNVEMKTRPEAGPTREQLEKVNELYLAGVRPIIEVKCFNCHGSTANLPWYYHLPFVRGLINDDIDEASEHLDFSNDFPFGGHGTPLEDLNAIEKSVVEGTMPPFRYKLMHWDHWLNDGDKKSILQWVKESKEIMNKDLK